MAKSIPARDLTFRKVKLAPLTHQELDDNFDAIDAAIDILDSDLTAGFVPERILDASPDGGVTDDF